MCGITGALWFDESQAISQASLETMTDSLEHRGPNDRGTLLEPLVHGLEPDLVEHE